MLHSSRCLSHYPKSLPLEGKARLISTSLCSGHERQQMPELKFAFTYHLFFVPILTDRQTFNWQGEENRGKMFVVKTQMGHFYLHSSKTKLTLNVMQIWWLLIYVPCSALLRLKDYTFWPKQLNHPRWYQNWQYLNISNMKVILLRLD